jgi:hypothetical protein
VNFEERRARIRALTPWIRECRAKLWLNHHELKVCHEPPDDSANATVFRPHNSALFKLWLSDDFLLDSPENQRQTIAHEMLHVWFGAMWDVIRAAESQMAPGTYRAWTEALESAEERTVDTLSWAIAPLLSLPWTEGE